jgi:hypothetical protein
MKSEKAIQNEILVAASSLPGAMFWREASAKAWVGRVVDYKNGRVTLEAAMPIVAGCPGIPDIMGIMNGRSIGLEVKTLTGKQEDTQVRFQRVYEGKGGIYRVVRSPEDAVAFLRATVGGSNDLG